MIGLDGSTVSQPRSSLKRRAERLLAIGVVAAALGTVPLVAIQESGTDDPLVVVADWTLWAVFALDFAAMMALSSDRRAYLRQNWLSAAIVVISFPLAPPLLATVRLTRLVRLLRLALAVGSAMQQMRLAIGRPGLLYVSAASGLLIVAGGGILTMLEPNTVKGDFWTGVWWAVVTTTTVGYGDIAPTTPEGRVVAVVLMITGLGLVATLSASIAAYFVSHDVEQKENAINQAMLDRLERMELALQELSREIRR